MNTNFSIKLAGLALALAVSATAPTAAYNGHTARALEPVVNVAAVTPLAMQYFCAQNPRECRSSGAPQVTMSPNLMAVLKDVNQRVNRNIRPQSDGSDAWTLNASAGDCEDYVLSKRSELVRRGVSSSALRIAFTHTRRGEPHAVLVVRTSEGDYVLDNLNNSVKTLRASGYNIRSMSSSDPRRWTMG